MSRVLSTCDRFGAVGSPSRLGHRPVRATARHTRVCLRVAVLSRWPQSRSAANLVSPNRSRLSPWSSSSQSSSPRSRSRAAFRASRVPHRRIATPCFVADYRSSPCAAPRREVREPARSALLSSTLGLSACSSPAFFALQNTPRPHCQGRSGVSTLQPLSIPPRIITLRPRQALDGRRSATPPSTLSAHGKLCRHRNL